MTRGIDRLPAPVLVLGGIVSVQFGGAIAQTLVPVLGAGGAVVMRLLFAALVLYAVVRPRLRGQDATAWRTVIAFGLALGLMNYTFYGSLAHLPIGVAVTIEFLGPLLLAASLSRRVVDLLAVAAAGLGVVLISQARHTALGDLEWTGILLALTAGACWAAYIVLAGRTGRSFPQLDGLAIAMVVASLATLPAGIGSIGEWTPALVAKGMGIALLSSLLPYSLELLALRRMTAQVFGTMLSLEPACAALAGLLILGQRLNVEQLAGMALVVGASVLVLGFGRSAAEPEHAAPQDGPTAP